LDDLAFGIAGAHSKTIARFNDSDVSRAAAAKLI